MKSILRQLLLFSFMALWIHAEEKAEVVALRSSPSAHLIHDYFPTAIYEGDGLTACFRVENVSGSKADFELSAVAINAAGKELKAIAKKASVGPGEFASVTLEFESQNVARIQYTLKSGAEFVAKSGVKLIRETDPWPKTHLAAGKISDATSGDVIVPVVQKKRTEERRAFAPYKWMFGEGKTSPSASSGKTLVFVPGAWKIKAASVELGPFRGDGTPPILNALNTVMQSIDANAMSGDFTPKSPAKPASKEEKVSDANGLARVVVVLPPEDLELATEPRAYHVLLEALISRLVRAGVQESVLIAPFKFGCNEVHRKALWREIHAVAGLYSARVVDPMDWMTPSVWQLDPATPGVYAPVPNATGRKMIEQALVDLIK